MPSVYRKVVDGVITYTCDDLTAKVKDGELYLIANESLSPRQEKCFNALVKKAKARDGVAKVNTVNT